MKGSRVQNVVQELRGEKIDIISWHVDAAKYVCNALSPAEISRVIKEFERLIDNRRGSWEVQLGIIELYAIKEDWEKILKTGNRILHTDKKEILEQLANILQNIIMQFPNNSEIQLQLGQTYQKATDYNKAIECYENVRKQTIEYNKELIDQLRKMGRSRVELPEAHLLLGTIFLFQGEYEKAQEEYQKLLKISTDYTEQMRINLQKAIDEDKNNTILPFMLGDLYLETDNIQPALEAYKQCIKINMDFASEVVKKF